MHVPKALPLLKTPTTKGSEVIDFIDKVSI